MDGHEHIPSPDSGKSTDNEGLASPIKIRSTGDANESDHEDCDDDVVMDLDNTARTGIIHALTNDSTMQCGGGGGGGAESMMTLTNGSLSAQE